MAQCHGIWEGEGEGAAVDSAGRAGSFNVEGRWLLLKDISLRMLRPKKKKERACPR